nr:2-oxoacid:acceptor oxidoreductase family protein [Marinitoga lauensis]
MRVFLDDLKDSRMQNMVILATMAKMKLIPEVKKEHYLEAINDLLSGKILENNITLFERVYNM